MRHSLPVAWLLCLAVLAGVAAPVRAAGRDGDIIATAGEILDSFGNLQLRGIPPALLKDAQGVAIIPHVIKAGFVIGGRHGRGVILVRGADGVWGKPLFLTLSGGSIGWQVGVQSTDLVLVFKTRSSLDRILEGKGKLTLGADAAVAAGPLGRQAEAATDGQLKAEIYSYSRSRGLFAGVSLEGAALLMDTRGTDAYYRTEPAAVIDPRTGVTVPVTPPSVSLQMQVTQMTAAGAPIIEPPPLPVPQAPLPLPTPLPQAPLPFPTPVPPPAPAAPAQPYVPQPLPR